MPIGGKGLAMVDARDVAEVAAIELFRREQSEIALPLDRINLVGPDTLTGTDVAAIWTDVLGRQIAYPGEDLAGFEQNLRQFMPKLDGARHASDGRALHQGGDDSRCWRRRRA